MARNIYPAGEHPSTSDVHDGTPLIAELRDIGKQQREQEDMMKNET